MFQKALLFLPFILIILLSSCNKSLPNKMPNIGVNSEELEFNKYIQLTAPKELNTYKAGKPINLEIKNLSEREWYFDITKDILIYKFESNEWERVSDKMINLGAIDAKLGVKGTYPLDKTIVGILPNVKLDQLTNLRIIIIVHEKTDGNEVQSKGTFIDVMIRP